MDAAPTWTANLLLASQTFFHVVGFHVLVKRVVFRDSHITFLRARLAEKYGYPMDSNQIPPF